MKMVRKNKLIKKKNKKKETKKLITKDMNLGETVMRYPRVAMVMMNYGLHCVGCHVATYETIEQGAKAHGMSDKDLNKMLDELNKVAKKPGEKPEAIPIEQEIKRPLIKKKSFFKKLFN